MRSLRPPIALAIASALLAAGSNAGCNSGPTLPVPPPNALVAGPPDADGEVTIRVEGLVEGAQALAYNPRTGEGVIGDAGGDGAAELVIEAQPGDTIRVWQRVGTDSSEVTTEIVPGGDAGIRPDAGSRPDGGPPPDGG